MTEKITVGLIYGGKSPEHEVSIRSARNVYDALDKAKYDVILILIDKLGSWYRVQDKDFTSTDGTEKYTPITINPGQGLVAIEPNGMHAISLDVLFPVLHGPNGEDGTIQGLLTLLEIPFVGAGVVGSAVGMDKDVMKRLLREAGIPTARSITCTIHGTKPHFSEVSEKLGLPLFIKPANMGSSVGISKATDKKSFDAAVEIAFQFDTKILIEEAIIGREIECSVLGGVEPSASLPGEILVAAESDFYTYDEKYSLESKVSFAIPPAGLSQEVIAEVRALAVKTFNVLCCDGLGRVDCFYTTDGKILVNEINTIPGFTSMSLYPVMWQKTDLPQTELIDKLIEDALRRALEKKTLKTSQD